MSKIGKFDVDVKVADLSPAALCSERAALLLKLEAIGGVWDPQLSRELEVVDSSLEQIGAGDDGA